LQRHLEKEPGEYRIVEQWKNNAEVGSGEQAVPGDCSSYSVFAYTIPFPAKAAAALPQEGPE